jgi:hypothetical protein
MLPFIYIPCCGLYNHVLIKNIKMRVKGQNLGYARLIEITLFAVVTILGVNLNDFQVSSGFGTISILRIFSFQLSSCHYVQSSTI